MRYGKKLLGLIDLCEYINLSKYDTVIEVGSYAGEGTEIFAEYAGKVIAIDAWQKGLNLSIGRKKQKNKKDFFMTSEVEESFDKRFKKYKNVYKVKAFDYEVVDTIKDNSAFLVYIDATHTYSAVKKYIERWYCKTDNWFGGHDFSHIWPGVLRAVQEDLGEPTKIFQDSSWIFKV